MPIVPPPERFGNRTANTSPVLSNSEAPSTPATAAFGGQQSAQTHQFAQALSGTAATISRLDHARREGENRNEAIRVNSDYLSQVSALKDDLQTRQGKDAANSTAEFLEGEAKIRSGLTEGLNSNVQDRLYPKFEGYRIQGESQMRGYEEAEFISESQTAVQLGINDKISEAAKSGDHEMLDNAQDFIEDSIFGDEEHGIAPVPGMDKAKMDAMKQKATDVLHQSFLSGYLSKEDTKGAVNFMDKYEGQMSQDTLNRYLPTVTKARMAATVDEEVAGLKNARLSYTSGIRKINSMPEGKLKDAVEAQWVEHNRDLERDKTLRSLELGEQAASIVGNIDPEKIQQRIKALDEFSYSLPAKERLLFMKSGQYGLLKRMNNEDLNVLQEVSYNDLLREKLTSGKEFYSEENQAKIRNLAGINALDPKDAERLLKEFTPGGISSSKGGKKASPMFTVKTAVTSTLTAATEEHKLTEMQRVQFQEVMNRWWDENEGELNPDTMLTTAKAYADTLFQENKDGTFVLEDIHPMEDIEKKRSAWRRVFQNETGAESSRLPEEVEARAFEEIAHAAKSTGLDMDSLSELEVKKIYEEVILESEDVPQEYKNIIQDQRDRIGGELINSFNNKLSIENSIGDALNSPLKAYVEPAPEPLQPGQTLSGTIEEIQQQLIELGHTREASELGRRTDDRNLLDQISGAFNALGEFFSGPEGTYVGGYPGAAASTPFTATPEESEEISDDIKKLLIENLKVLVAPTNTPAPSGYPGAWAPYTPQPTKLDKNKNVTATADEHGNIVFTQEDSE